METPGNELLKVIGEPTEFTHLITTVMDHLPDPAFLLDKNGTVITWNRSISELTGVAADSIIGKGNYEHCFYLFGKRRPILVDRLIEKILDPPPQPETDHQHLRTSIESCLYENTTCLDASGRKRDFQLKATPLFSTAGNLFGAIASLHPLNNKKENDRHPAGTAVKISGAMREKIITSLQKLLEEKSEETVEHAFRINKHASAIGRALGLSPAEMHELTLLAALHDLGKIAIPDSIILKADRLTPEEWEIMKKHSEIGYNITRAIPELSHISRKILHHHEWWNGEGYPYGLSGEEIPLLSRIIAVVDAYDVMISGRSYKKSLTPEEALGELHRYSGAHFEPRLVDIFTSFF